MGWVVVKFVKENKVEAVPRSWFLQFKKYCYWPPPSFSSKKVIKIIEFEEKPTYETWPSYPAELLGEYGKQVTNYINNYEHTIKFYIRYINNFIYSNMIPICYIFR